jgi:hypothetical protein
MLAAHASLRSPASPSWPINARRWFMPAARRGCSTPASLARSHAPTRPLASTDPGEAAVIERYGKERAVVLHPDDFHRLLELDQLVEDTVALEPFQLSEEAIRAHREEATPGEPVTDPTVIEKLFG